MAGAQGDRVLGYTAKRGLGSREEHGVEPRGVVGWVRDIPSQSHGKQRTSPGLMVEGVAFHNLFHGTKFFWVVGVQSWGGLA